MADLARLLRRLEAVKARRDIEKRIHGKTRRFRDLTAQYYQILHEVGRATEK